MLRGLVAALLAAIGIANATLVFLNESTSLGEQILTKSVFEFYLSHRVLANRGGLQTHQKNAFWSLKPGPSGANNPLVTVPGNEYHFIGTDIDWLYSTIPQVHGANLSINLSSGKVISFFGFAQKPYLILSRSSVETSAVNGLVWVRGAQAEYDAYEQLGSPGWNWDNMYAAMKKSERLNEPSPALRAEYGYYAVPSSHGSTGPINVSFPPFIPIQHQKFINASIELGHSFNADPYSGNNTGSFWSLSSQNVKSVRVTSEFGYLDPVVNRQNLIVFSGGLVTRLALVETSGIVTARAVYVRFPDGSEQLARLAPGGEVIMSAGTVRTPQLLELSGIGNKDILDKFNISVQLDLPAVGENYEDHTITLLTYQLKPGYPSDDTLGYNSTFLAEQQQLYTQDEGFLTFAISGVIMAPIESFLNESEIETAKQILSTKPPTIYPDLFNTIKEEIFSGIPQIEFLLFNSFSAGNDKQANTSYCSIAITHVHPMSRGSIHLNSTSINDHPLINPNVLEAEWDTWILSKATAYARRFFQTQPMLDIFEPDEIYPGSSVETEEEWIQYVTENINIGYHSVGTSSLLPQGKGGVVDSNLKVYGTSNIRVVDNSILPLLLSAHTQPAAYAIAERAAEIILSGS
ncbi:hypothetical protein F5887DRAFT_1081185 [Amanita rubescens]|nr:hypothetical protein F5887DRAFT_1081185 [Amanita rubescens]